MKRKITLSIALVLSIVTLSLIKSDSTVNAEPPQKFIFDTGIVTLGPGQILRVTSGALPTGLTLNSFRKIGYEPISNEAGITSLAISSQSVSPPLTLMPGEGASIDIPNTAFGVRGVVLSNSRDVKVTALIIDSSGQVNSVIDVSGYFAP